MSIAYRGPRATTWVTRLAPGCVLVTLFGYDDGHSSGHYFRALDLEIARTGWVAVFIDSRYQTGVSPAARDACAQWAKRNRSVIRANHLLFRSKILELAVAVVNLATGGITKAHSNVARFEAVIREHVPTFRALPKLEPHAASSAAHP